MANPNHVDRLKESADAWNRYRKQSGETPDLNEADLSGISIAGADLRGALMFRTNLRGALNRYGNRTLKSPCEFL